MVERAFGDTSVYPVLVRSGTQMRSDTRTWREFGQFLDRWSSARRSDRSRHYVAWASTDVNG